MKIPTAIMAEEYERRWVREKQRAIEARRRELAIDRAWDLWVRRRRGLLGVCTAILIFWMANGF